MLLNAVIFGDVRVAARRITARVQPAIIAMHVPILCPMKVGRRVAVGALHLCLAPMNITLHARDLGLVLVGDAASMASGTGHVHRSGIAEHVAGHQPTPDARRAAHVALATGSSMAGVTVIADHRIERIRTGLIAAREQHGSVPVQAGVQVVPGCGHLVSVALGTQTDPAGLADQAVVGYFLQQRIAGTPVTGDAAIAAVHRLQELGIVEVYGLPRRLGG